MQFEGTQVNIPIKGIMRAGTDNLSADGAMNEVIGMEYKDGSWLPYKTTDEDWTVYVQNIHGTYSVVTGITKAYVHKTSDGEQHYIYYIGEYGALIYESGRDEDLKYIYCKSLIDEGVKDIEFVGNMLCVSTETKMKYYIWQEGGYVAYSYDYNGLPVISFRVTKGIYNKEISRSGIEGLLHTTYLGELDVSVIVGSDDEKLIKHAMASAMTAVQGELRNRGGITGYFLVCYAFRMKNGDIVLASAPILLSRPMISVGKKITNYDSTLVSTDFKEYIDSAEVELNVNVQDEKSAVFCSPILPSITQGTVSGQFEYVYPKLVNWTLEEWDFSLAPKTFYGTDTTTMLLLHKDGYKRIGSTGYYEYSPFPYSGRPDTVDSKYLPSPGLPPLSCTVQSRQTQSNQPYISQVNAFALSNKLQMSILSGSIPEDKDIQSVCIFMSQEIDPYVYLDENRLDTCLVENFNDFKSSAAQNLRVHMASAKIKDVETLKEEIKQIRSLYLVKEIQREEFNTLIEDYGTDWISIDLEGVLGENLVVREQLTLPSFNRDTLIPNHIESYNLRLHIYDYVTYLFKGYKHIDYVYRTGTGQYAESVLAHDSTYWYKWEIQVTLKDSGGRTKLVTYSEDATSSIIRSLSPIIIYPTNDAQSFIIRLYKYSGPSATSLTRETVYEKEFNFLHDFGLGMAYYLNPDLSPILPSLLTGELPPESSDVPSLQEENVSRYSPNVMRVSDVAYPSYFPTKYTYSIGDGRILGVGRLTIPVSQDNYGGYALFVFCTDGIYTLDVDTSGNGVYTNMRYFSPEVCVNANSICEIGGAIVFASDKGLMILTPNGVEEFTPHLNGEIRFRPDSTGQYIKDGQHIYDKMVTDPLLTELSGSLSTQDFIDYLHEADTVVSYISKKNMLVVYNKNKTYIYLIDIATRNTTKLDICIAFDDDNSPVETYFVENGEEWTSRVFGYRSQEGSTDCLIQSRPIKIQQDDKCSYRLVVTGYFEGAENTDKWAGLIVLGSIDGDHWHVIGVNNECLDAPFHNIGCVTNRGSWKYLMFIFAGHLSTDSHIDSIDITVESKYRNKKR